MCLKAGEATGRPEGSDASLEAIGTKEGITSSRRFKLRQEGVERQPFLILALKAFSKLFGNLWVSLLSEGLKETGS